MCASSMLCVYIICLTCVHQIGFAAADAITGLKLIEAGVPKEKLALLGKNSAFPNRITLPPLPHFTPKPYPNKVQLVAV